MIINYNFFLINTFYITLHSQIFFISFYENNFVILVIKYLFEEVKLDFIAGCFFKRNIRSKRVQEKNGFKFYKDVIYETRYGTKEDSVYMILTKEDYEKLQTEDK